MPHHSLPCKSNFITTTPFVIIIDDDKDDVEILSTSLEQFGIKVKSFDSSEIALFYLKNIPKSEQLPSLIIIDYNIPRINGRQLLTLIKDTGCIKHISVIIYSTYISTLLEKSLLSLDVYECLTKATSQEDLTKHINRFKELAYLFHTKHEVIS